MGRLISIITVNYKNAAGLEKTIQSVVAQDYSFMEYLIIDGGSTDGSRELLEKYSNKLAYWVSEPDSGIYNAMNKGINAATGEYLLFLNSGDQFNSSTSLSEVANHLGSHDIVYGDLVIKSDSKEWVKKYPASVSLSYLFKEALPHPSMFIRRNLFNTVGYYNEELRIVSDWEFYTSAIFQYSSSYLHIGIPVSIFHLDGMSSNKAYEHVIQNERRQVFQRLFPSLIEDYEELIELRDLERKVYSNRFIKLGKALGLIHL